MPCARRLLSLQACALLATGRPLVATALRLFGFSAASSLPPRRPLVWKVLKRLTISILAQDKPRLTTVTKSPVEEQKDNQDSTTRIEDQDGILLSPGPKQSFGGHTGVFESYDRTHNQSLNRWIRFVARSGVSWTTLSLDDDAKPIAKEETTKVS